MSERRSRPPAPRDARRGATEPGVAARPAPRAAAGWTSGIVIGSLLIPVLLLFGGFLISDTMLYGSDMVPMGYMARKLYQVMWTKFGEFPLWNPYILGGLPFVDALHGDIFYPTTALKFLFPLHRGIGLVLVLHVFLAGLFMFLCLRGEGLSKPAAWFGGIAYMAGPYLISLFLAGHDAKIYVTTLFPLAYLALRRAERLGRVGDYAALGLVLGALILTSHIQMAYFAMWALGLRFLTHLWGLRAQRRRLARDAALFAASLALCVSVGAVQLFPSYAYTSRFGPRAGGLRYETSTSWSLHPEEVVSLVMPEFVSYQHETWDGYWGRNPFKLNCESPGVIPALLAIAFLAFAREKGRRFVGFLIAGALVYALGANTPVFRVFYTVIPGVKLFRAPSIIAFLIHFGVVMLAARAVERWVVRRAAPEESRRALMILGGYAALALIVLALGPGLLGLWRPFHPALSAAKAKAFDANIDNLRLGALLGVGAAALVGWAVRAPAGAGRSADARRAGAAVPAATGAVVALAAATLLMDWRIGRDFIRYDRLESYIRSDAAIEFLRSRSEPPFRVLSATQKYPANYLPIFEIESPQGFHDNRVRTFDDLFMKDQTQFGRPAMMDLLNVKYIVADRPLAAFREVFRSSDAIVYENPNVLPRASLHRRAEALGDAETLARMKAADWSPRDGVLLDRAPGIALDPAADASGDRATITRYTPNRIAVAVAAGTPALLLVTNNFLPYWHATVDGAGAPVLRADYTFLAVPVPAGEHEVVLTFRSAPFERALAVSLGGLAIGVAAVALGRRRVKASAGAPEPPPADGAR